MNVAKLGEVKILGQTIEDFMSPYIRRNLSDNTNYTGSIKINPNPNKGITEKMAKEIEVALKKLRFTHKPEHFRHFFDAQNLPKFLKALIPVIEEFKIKQRSTNNSWCSKLHNAFSSKKAVFCYGAATLGAAIALNNKFGLMNYLPFFKSQR